MKLKSIEELLERINRYKISPSSMEGKPLILISPKEDVYDDNEWSYLDNFLEVNIKANILPEHRLHLIQTIRKEVEGVDLKMEVMHDHEYILDKTGKDIKDDILTLLTTLEG